MSYNYSVHGYYFGAGLYHLQSFKTEDEAFDFLESMLNSFQFLDLRFKDKVIVRYWIREKRKPLPPLYRGYIKEEKP